MGCFLTRAKKNNIILDNSSIVGRFGFSLTQNLFTSFINSFYNHYMNSGYKRICISHDGTEIPSVLFSDILLPEFKKLGLISHIPDTPTTTPQFVWFCQESSLSTLGIYIKTLSSWDNIEIQLYNKDKPLDKIEFKQLLKTTDKISIQTLSGFEEEDSIFFNIDGYFKWLKESKLVSLLPATINIDTMFGASCYISNTLRKHKGISVNLFNLQTDPPRLKNYISKPTGQFLKWYTTYGTVKRHQFFFALDNSGSTLGVYDLKQDTEISCAGVGILLLKHLKEIIKLDSANIAVSKAVNSKVVHYIKKLGYSTFLVSNGIYSLLELQDKNIKIDLYIDEQGGYYFFGDKIIYTNPFIAMFRLIELSIVNNKSFGEMLDEISKEFKKTLYHNNFFLSSQFIPLENLINKCKSSPNLKKYKTDKYFSIFTFKDKSRLVLKNNIKAGMIEVFIESQDGNKAKELGELVSNLIKEYTDVLE